MLLPIDHYKTTILTVLYEQGGSGKRKDVRLKVGERLNDKLAPQDFEKTSSGDIRWKARVGWAR